MRRSANPSQPSQKSVLIRTISCHFFRTLTPETNSNEEPAPSGLENLRKSQVLAALLFLTATCAFLPALKNDFVNYDDPKFVADNPFAQQGWTWAGFKWAFTANVLGNWHPITNLSHLTDCQLFGLRPWGRHLTNALLHALNSALLLASLTRVASSTARAAKKQIPISFIAGLFMSVFFVGACSRIDRCCLRICCFQSS